MSVIDGKLLSEKRIEELLRERHPLGPLTLGIVVMQTDAVTTSFITIKAQVAERLGVLMQIFPRLQAVGDVDGVILQLPLPKGVDTDTERNKIPLMKDVDILSDAAYQKFVDNKFPPPPVPRAMDYIMKSYGISYVGKRVVVVGQGRLVGMPAAELFRKRGAEVRALVKGDDVAAYTRDADIVILGAGVPHLLKPEMVKEDVVILDAGTSETGGVVVGDADPACAEKASLMTPVPRGVGPLAVVEIFANLFELKRKQ